MAATGKRAVQVSVRISAPVASVWAAWTDPILLCQWYPDRIDGELEVGHTVTLGWDAYGVEIALEVAAMEPDRRLVLRAGEGPAAGQVQEVTLSAAGDGNTVVRLVHSGFADGAAARDERDGTASGWQMMLAVLRHYVERYFTRPRRSVAALGFAPVDFATLHAHYCEADYLRRWLTESGAIGAVGDPVELTLRNGRTLTGEVLSRYPGRDVAFSCREISGVIALRALSAGVVGRAGLIGVWVSSWAPDDPVVGEIEEALAAAVDRLVALLGPPGPSSEA